jgi:hypothetical protein
MSRTLRSARFWLGGAVATVALAGTAYATIPGGDGAIHGCYAKSGGTLRVIDAAVTACKSGETALDWNQQGVPGPSGPQGQPGVSGYQILTVRATRNAGGPANEVASASLTCPANKKAIAGGARVVEVRDDGSDLPANADVDVELQTSAPLADGAGWAALAREDGNVDVRWGLRTYAICAAVE